MCRSTRIAFALRASSSRTTAELSSESETASSRSASASETAQPARRRPVKIVAAGAVYRFARDSSFSVA
jgi:hypothetical protein